MNKFRLSTFAVSLSFSLSVAAPLQAQQPQNYEITQVADGLYRAATSSHRTVFLVTEEGIILADPIHTDFSTWLKSELQQRFGVPVRYVLYSHHHWDHASGGAVFADTATFVAHEDMAAALAAPLPSNATVSMRAATGFWSGARRAAVSPRTSTGWIPIRTAASVERRSMSISILRSCSIPTA
jgi:metal-dependent hydrolase (beta-lactamase superfamily II)